MAVNDLYFSWSYPWQKLSAAAEVLATSFAPGWQRMLWAVEGLAHLMPDHFPEKDLYDRLEKLLDEVRAFGPLESNGKNWRGAFENTLRRRKRLTLERYAKEIMAIHDEISDRRGHYVN